MNTTFCLYCGKEVEYTKVSAPTTVFVRGFKLEYDEVRAHCPICNRELYVHEINDANVDARLKAYRQAVEENEYE